MRLGCSVCSFRFGLSSVGGGGSAASALPLAVKLYRSAPPGRRCSNVELTCVRANVKYFGLRTYSGDGSHQTVAVQSIEALVARRGPVLARQVLEVIANAERGPITAPQIKAVELLLSEPDYADHINPEDLTVATVDLLYTAEDEAKLFAVTHKVPLWRALAVAWFRKCRKRRGTKAA